MGQYHHSTGGPGQKNILVAVVLNLVITVTEYAGGIISGSLALVSDATHNLSDTFALLIAYIARIVGRKPRTQRNTFGYKRVEILAAFINAMVLIIISVYLFYEAYRRFMHPRPIREDIMFIVALIGLLANLFSVFLLHRRAGQSLNIRSAYLHLLGDTLSSAAVILGAVFMYFFGVYWLDPLLTVIIGVFILKETYGILAEALNILMEAGPVDLDIEEIRRRLEQIPLVDNVHHIHLWQISDNEVHIQCHADLKEDLPVSRADKIRLEMERILKEEFPIHHVTIQTEYNSCDEKESVGHLKE